MIADDFVIKLYEFDKMDCISTVSITHFGETTKGASISRLSY